MKNLVAWNRVHEKKKHHTNPRAKCSSPPLLGVTSFKTRPPIAGNPQRGAGSSFRFVFTGTFVFSQRRVCVYKESIWFPKQQANLFLLAFPSNIAKCFWKWRRHIFKKFYLRGGGRLGRLGETGTLPFLAPAREGVMPLKGFS